MASTSDYSERGILALFAREYELVGNYLSIYNYIKMSRRFPVWKWNKNGQPKLGELHIPGKLMVQGSTCAYFCFDLSSFAGRSPQGKL